MTFVLDGLRRSGKPLLRSALTKKGSVHALQALFLLRRRLLLMQGLLRKSCTLRLLLLLLPSLQEGRLRRGGGLRMHLVLRPVRLPLLPLDLGPARGVEVSLVARLVRASALLSLLLLWDVERGELLLLAASLVASPRSSLHALRRGEFRGPLSSAILSCFPIFRSRNKEGSWSPLSVG